MKTVIDLNICIVLFSISVITLLLFIFLNVFDRFSVIWIVYMGSFLVVPFITGYDHYRSKHLIRLRYSLCVALSLLFPIWLTLYYSFIKGLDHCNHFSAFYGACNTNPIFLNVLLRYTVETVEYLLIAIALLAFINLVGQIISKFIHRR